MLQLHNVSKSYGNKEVLKDLNFEIEKGMIVSLLGQNGSGKTTTFKIIANLVPADTGKVLFNKQNIENKIIGYLPEQRSMYFDCTVFQQLRFITRINKINDENGQTLINAYLERMKMSNFINEKVGNLSKGNQQKISLIMAIIKNPQIVILDEPFTGLDINNIEIFKKEILKLKQENRIVIVSSHIYQPINDICDQYLYLSDGKLELNIKKEQLNSNPQRVITIENNDFDFVYPGIIKEDVKGNKTKLIVDNQTDASKIVKTLQKENANYEIRNLKIEDMIK